MPSATLRFDQREDLIAWNQAIISAGGAGVVIPTESSIPPHTTADLLRTLVAQAVALGGMGATVNDIPAVVDDRDFGELYDRVNAVVTSTGSALDSSTTAWKNAVINNGGTVSNGRANTVNTLIVGLKSDGIWSKLDRLWLLAAENQQSALTDIKATALATAVNSPTFAPDVGFTGDASSKYIDTGYTPSTDGVAYTLNSCHLSIWTAVFGSGGKVLAGSRNASIGNSGIYDYYYGDFTHIFTMNDASSSSPTVPVLGSGWTLGTRTGASARAFYVNGGNKTTDTTSSAAIAVDPVYILAINGSGFVSFQDDSTISAVSLGGGLSDANAANFYSRLSVYMNQVLP
jgi:hypothetical protein